MKDCLKITIKNGDKQEKKRHICSLSRQTFHVFTSCSTADVSLTIDYLGQNKITPDQEIKHEHDVRLINEISRIIWCATFPLWKCEWLRYDVSEGVNKNAKLQRHQRLFKCPPLL